MAGHSKWANIKHKKAAADKKRGKVFSVLVKKISSAARRGGGDLDTNAELRMLVDKARAANMPNDTVQRAILKATGQLEGITYEDFSYEGYGSGGVAVMVDGATDNRNRTVAAVRHAFAKHGGNMGENGCVAWMFHARGIISLSREQVDDADRVMELALEHGAIEFEDEGGVITITTEPQDFMGLRDALEGAGYDDFLTDEVTRVAETTVTPELDDARRVMTMLEMFEDDDDIENVYHNLDLSDDVAAALEDG